MGVINYLVNREAKTLFELGKGAIFAEEILERLSSETALVGYIYNDDDFGTDLNYATGLAARLTAFVGQTDPTKIELHTDSGDEVMELLDQSWPVVDSRYSNEWELEGCSTCKSRNFDACDELEHTPNCELAIREKLRRRWVYE